jgi:hypothetical protein
MSVENCVRLIEGGYLHFNRVDSYQDFPDADRHDGEQLPGDRVGNAASTFAKAPGFSAADYYDRSRSRTYAFCAALEDADHVWTYGGGTPRGKVGLVFDFDSLRATLNRKLESGAGALEFNGIQCRQIFDLNWHRRLRRLGEPSRQRDPVAQPDHVHLPEGSRTVRRRTRTAHLAVRARDRQIRPG